MCGICGYVGDHCPELLKPMCDAQAHRGPDDAGQWHDQEAQVGLGHRRLSIIDLSAAGHQPMPNEDRQVWISYNGEIYNFPELREQLLSAGHQFRSRTDTEVLVHLYEDRGLDFLNELNGIFALAIWDFRERRLLLARDHAGIKPLYYWQDGPRLFFASEIKALLRVPGVPRELNTLAVTHYLRFCWLPGEQTMLKAIRKLEPGHYLVWKDGRAETKRWFSLSYEPEDGIAQSEWIERVHDTFMRTTRRQMVSDVPLGAYLSGGTDSSAIVACMRHSFPDRQIKCYTVQFDPGDMALDRFEEDYPFAKRVAEHLRVDLKSFVLKSAVISDLPRMIYHCDEPDADPAVFPCYLIAKFAREDGVTVLLSGTGGDEVFFGYRSHLAYRQYERWWRWMPSRLTGPALGGLAVLGSAVLGAQSPLPRRVRKFRRGLLEHGLARHLEIVDWSSPQARRRVVSRGFADSLPALESVPDCMRRYFDGFVGHGELNRHSHVLIQTFLSAHNFLYTDKSSMAASVEVRVPYMDVELMQLGARIPERDKLRGDTTKYVLKKAMERYLPGDVLYRSKTGFGAPLRKWICDDLNDVISELLGPKRIAARGIFEPAAVQEVIEQNRANRADHAYLIYALLVLELWQQMFIDRAGVEVSL